MQAEIDPRARRGLRRASGFMPGVQAGAMMLLVTAIVSIGRGRSALEPLQILAGGVLRRGQPTATVPTVIAGLFMHFLLSGLLGGLFAHAIGRTGRVRQLGAGLAYGVVLWLLAQLVLLPLLYRMPAVPPGWLGSFLVGHIAYGLMLGALVPTAGDIDDHRPS